MFIDLRILKIEPLQTFMTTSLFLDTFWLLQIWNSVLRQEEVTLCVSFHHWVILFFCGFSGFSIVHCSSIIHLGKISNILGDSVCFLQPFQQYEAVDIFFELFYKNSSLSCYDIFAEKRYHLHVFFQPTPNVKFQFLVSFNCTYLPNYHITISLIWLYVELVAVWYISRG